MVEAIFSLKWGEFREVGKGRISHSLLSLRFWGWGVRLWLGSYGECLAGQSCGIVE